MKELDDLLELEKRAEEVPWRLVFVAGGNAIIGKQNGIEAPLIVGGIESNEAQLIVSMRNSIRELVEVAKEAERYFSIRPLGGDEVKESLKNLERKLKGE